VNASSGSTDSTTESGRESHDSRHDTSSQAAKDFKEASDYFTSRKTTTSGNITDNNASSRVDQFAASLSSAKNSYDQYTTSRTRSHEYSEMASRTESMTGQMSENLTQQFANFVQHRAPQDAEAILTNTSSPEIAAQREALAREFVKEQVEPRVDAAYQQGRESIGQNMAGVSGGGDNGSVMADYGQNSGRIDAMTQDAGIKDNVGQKVDGMIAENKQQHQETRENIQQQGVEVKKENAELENDHKTKGNDFKNSYNDKKEHQTRLPGADSTKELLDKATKLENEKSKDREERMLTHQIIQSEIDELKLVLTEKDLTIPSFWSCIWPGLTFMFWFLLSSYFSYGISDFSTGLDRISSMVFAAVVGIFSIIATANTRSLFLSLPESFRKSRCSLVF
jgi:conjugal transfer mating pair stabilization protein TraG